MWAELAYKRLMGPPLALFGAKQVDVEIITLYQVASGCVMLTMYNNEDLVPQVCKAIH